MPTTNKGPCACCDATLPCAGDIYSSHPCALVSSVTLLIPALEIAYSDDIVYAGGPGHCCQENHPGDGGFASAIAGTYVVPFGQPDCLRGPAPFGEKRCDGFLQYGRDDSPAKGVATGAGVCVASNGYTSDSRDLETWHWLQGFRVNYSYLAQYDAGNDWWDETFSLAFNLWLGHSYQTRGDFTGNVSTNGATECNERNTNITGNGGVGGDYSYSGNTPSQPANCLARANTLLGLATRNTYSSTATGTANRRRCTSNPNISFESYSETYDQPVAAFSNFTSGGSGSNNVTSSPTVVYKNFYDWVDAIQITSIQ